MFETASDQADGLRRHFARREAAVIPVGCGAPAGRCRGYAANVIDRLEAAGYTPVLFDRLDLDSDLGDVEPHPPVDRVLLLDEPVRLARWLDGRAQTMLLLLSCRPGALPPHYATIKSIVLNQNVRRFATVFVDAPTVEDSARAHHQLASCARRFLDVEIEPLARAGGDTVLGDLTPAGLRRFEVEIRDPSPYQPLSPPDPQLLFPLSH